MYTATVKEDVSIGYTLPPVTAQDSDVSAAFNTIAYSILSGNTGTVWRFVSLYSHLNKY